MALIRLVYVSTAITEYDDAELDKLLESSVRHNTPQQVTGMLLYTGGNFMQVLEGEEAAIDEVYGRIAKDPRHKDLFVLERGPIKERDFKHWSMGFRRLDKTDVTAHPGYAAFFELGFDAALIGARSGGAMEMLKEFGVTQR